MIPFLLKINSIEFHVTSMSKELIIIDVYHV